jgi:predicted anti-sigma-YlaC factor YlaD
MKAIVKIKFWPLIIVGLVWLFGTIVPFANGIVRLLTAALTEIVDAIFPRVLTTEYTVVATLLGPLAPAAGSDAEIILRAGFRDHNLRRFTDRAILASGAPSFAAA